jgi:pimeloyl-ACP methyl ester carboxylesterase
MDKILLLALALSSSIALAGEPGDVFAQPHRLVDIGGRKLNLFCSGSGSPTVVFESPSGAGGWAWWEVQPRVAARTRACVYDRAGFGFSDPTPRAADANDAVEDLHALLAAAAIAPPFVLVGNSVGGAAAQLFAWRHPDEISGLVLVEPMHEDENVRADALTHGGVSEGEAQILEFGNACAAQATKGFAAGTEAYRYCIGGVDPAVHGQLGATELQLRMKPAFWRVRQAERAALATDRSQLRAARRPFGDLPVIVLARGVSPYLIPGKPQSETNKAIEAANLTLLTDVARSSTRGEVRVVAGAGHEIQETHPDAVVAAVADVLARVRR